MASSASTARNRGSRGRISCNEDRAHRRRPPRNDAGRGNRQRAGCPHQGRTRAHVRQGRDPRKRRHPRPGRPHCRRRQQPLRTRRRNDRRSEWAAGDSGSIRRPHPDRPRGSEPGGVHLRRRAQTHGARVAAHVAAGIRRHARLQCAVGLRRRRQRQPSLCSHDASSPAVPDRGRCPIPSRKCRRRLFIDTTPERPACLLDRP